MVKSKILRVISIVMSVAIYLMQISFSINAYSLKASNKSGFNIPTLSGDQGTDVAAIASANIGKKRSAFGYTGAWCAYFATDCAELVGVSKSIVPNYGSTTLFYENMINKRGATKIVTHEYNSSTVNVISNPKPGDFILIRWDGMGYTDGTGVDSNGNRVDKYMMSHTAIVVDYNSSTKVVTYVGGNQGNGSNETNPVSKESLKITSTLIARIIRPAYTSNIPYANIDAGTYYIKNNSTGTYLSVDSAIAADKQNVSVADKSNSKAFQFKTTGGTEHYLYSMLDNNYVLNPYSDTPTVGTNVTLFKKVTDGTQIWGFEKANGGYIIRLKYNPNCVLAVSGSNVQLATYTGAANQIWTLEKADLVLSSIKINEDSFCSIYENGSTFKADGLTLTATYSDGSTKNITEGYTLSEVNIGTVGEATLTATYSGKTATATITINDLFEGEGTDSSPYLVNTALDLENVAKMVNNPLANGCYGHASYKQTADIDLSEYSNWTPIGMYNVDAEARKNDPRAIFRGIYNGNCHKITNLTVNTNGLNAGLFGRLNYTVDETTLIENLSVSGNITGQPFPNNELAGGIAGVVGDGAIVRNCSFTGTINGSGYVGGIAGMLHNGGTIENCYVNANISSTAGNIGGICGKTSSGEYAVSYNAVVKNCYFVGEIADGKSIGGISGLNVKGEKCATSIIYTNNYYLNSAASGGVAGSAQAGCTGLISSQLKTIAADLGSPFADNADDTLNNGYPVFEWQIETSDEKVSGDANNDGAIDLKDVVIIRRYVAGGWDVEIDAANADVNADDTVDLKDVVLIRRYIAGGWDVELK